MNYFRFSYCWGKVGLVRVLLEGSDQILRVLFHIPLEVLHEVHNGKEGLVAVHLVSHSEGGIGVNASAEDDSPVVAVDYELHTGVGLVAERDIAGLVDTGGHLGSKVGDYISNLHLGEISFHMFVVFLIILH